MRMIRQNGNGASHKLSSILATSSGWNFTWLTTTTAMESRTDNKSTFRRWNHHHDTNNKDPIKIGIVGGGIMGITVAHSLLETLPQSHHNLDIVLFEGDSYAKGIEQYNQNRQPPDWKAATARNANTIAVGASMHIFSTRTMVYSLLKEGFDDVVESLQKTLGINNKNNMTKATLEATSTSSALAAFATPPPFFSFQPYYCLGPGSSSWSERYAFVNFGIHYWYNALVHGGAEASKERSQTLVQLAKATRHKFVQEIAPSFGCTSNWYTEGLLSIHRTKEEAEEVLQECQDHDLPARLLSRQEALEHEPLLEKLPIEGLHVVLREADLSANCEQYMRLLLDNCLKNDRVKYQEGKVTRIDKSKNQYTIFNDKGESINVDLVVLAAGAQTPLLAQPLGVAHYIPTYPLRGFSLTTIVPKPFWRSHGTNVLHTAMALDGLYMSSVKPWMARFTGFGELAGFDATRAPSKGPFVLKQYAQAVVGSSGEPIPCLRPMSPDDVPIVGSLGNGLFVHTGHGTLGWTTAFATADCCAQDVADYLNGEKRTKFVLPDGTELEKERISPSRFGWF